MRNVTFRAFIRFVFIFFIATLITSSMVCVFGEETLSNTVQSEKLIYTDDPERDKKLLRLTGNDRLAEKIINQHSLIIGSKFVTLCRREVYSWLVNHITVSAALARIIGMNYQVSPGTIYQYHVQDGEGLNTELYYAYRDSSSTVFIGVGKVKVFPVTISFSALNYQEYYDIDTAKMSAQNCMYVRINNSVFRFFANIIITLTDIEKLIMNKTLKLDDTAYQIVTIFMEDPYLYRILQNPSATFPEGASDITISMRDAIVQESSLKEAQELGKLIENARNTILETSYEKE